MLFSYQLTRVVVWVVVIVVTQHSLPQLISIINLFLGPRYVGMGKLRWLPTMLLTRLNVKQLDWPHLYDQCY